MRYSVTIRPDAKGRLAVTVTFNGERVRVNLGYTINPKEWNAKREELKPMSVGAGEVNHVLNKIRCAIDEVMCNEPTSDAVKNVINVCLGKREKSIDSDDILEWWSVHNRERDVSQKTLEGYDAAQKIFANYLEIKKKSSKFASVTPTEVERFYLYLRKNLSHNYANTTFKRFKAMWRWCKDRIIEASGKDIGYPFKIKAQGDIYGTPNWLSREEVRLLLNAELTGAKERIRDIFVFQSLTGCRVSDMVQLKKSNVYEGVLSYIPQKTKNKRAEVIRVPLSMIALSIVEKYANDDNEALLPFISPQKYNDRLKGLFKFLELSRPITRLNPHTNETEIVPLYRIASSHLARRTFVGRLYEADVKDSVIASMSGHAEGSKAFNRYRAVTEELKNNAIKALE
jgi:integrase